MKGQNASLTSETGRLRESIHGPGPPGAVKLP
jgi:hypothetical protein